MREPKRRGRRWRRQSVMSIFCPEWPNNWKDRSVAFTSTPTLPHTPKPRVQNLSSPRYNFPPTEKRLLWLGQWLFPERDFLEVRLFPKSRTSKKGRVILNGSPALFLMSVSLGRRLCDTRCGTQASSPARIFPGQADVVPAKVTVGGCLAVDGAA